MVVPAVLAATGRAGQREDVRSVGDAGDGARLHGRGADLLEADPAEDLAEALYALLEQPLQRLGRDVAAGAAGAAGGDHRLDPGIVDPLLYLGADHLHVVGDDGAVGQHMAVAGDALDQGVARLFGVERAGVGNRQHGDVHGLEGLGLVDPVHWLAPGRHPTTGILPARGRRPRWEA